ncbi:MAG: hypothetical protein D6743_01940 [Calditrichaeota bacterium]|nr:MAG: hypothetical protein D6743_01940 [Calditrichota bacterium]
MPAEAKPVLYRLIRVVVKAAMAIFFQKMEVRHGEVIPERGPVVFVANHPNSIMDALVMGLVTRRKVNYVGHAGLFSNRLKSWFLRSCGVIPIYRKEDAPEKMDQNVYAFEACYRTLEKGETIGIFPEGTSDMLRKVKKVKTGAARIVLEAERRNNYRLGVQIIPIGLYFFSRSRFRSRVLLNVGKPLDLRPYFELNEKDNYEAVARLTAEIQRSLEQLTVNIRHEELDELVRDIELLYRDELKSETAGMLGHSPPTVAEFVLTQKIADCVEYFYERDRERIRQLHEKITLYKRKLKRLHLKDAMVKEKTSFSETVKESMRSMVKALLGFPLACYGIVNNFIPYAITETIAKRFVNDRTKILSALLIGGGVSFLFFYWVQVFAVGFFFGHLWGLIYLVSLPVSGMFALAYVKEVREEQKRISFSFFLFTNRQLFNRMRRERRLLISELDAIKEEYLRVIGLSSPDLMGATG